jgi:hypothetical protein
VVVLQLVEYFAESRIADIAERMTILLKEQLLKEVHTMVGPARS